MKNMTLILVLVTAVFAAVGTASAELTLYIDATGQAYINNDTGSAVTFDACEIHSAGSLLDPSEFYPGQTSGWRSFGDWLGEDMMAAYAALGHFGWGELAAQTHVVSDGNLSGSTTLADGGSLFIGFPAPSATPADSHTAGSGDYGDLKFYYLNSAVSTEKIDGNIDVIPEPATLTLLGLGGLALIRRRRRA
jgi:PEP-CTERM motif